jgi:hypothetical protein
LRNSKWYKYRNPTHGFYIYSAAILIGIICFNSDLTICLYKNLLGKDCFGCGMTRALVSFIQLDILEGVKYNYKALIVFPILLTVSVKNLKREIKLKKGY